MAEPLLLDQGLTMTATTMTATNHDNQLGEIYPTMLNELKCTYGISFSRFNYCGRRGHGLRPSCRQICNHNALISHEYIHHATVLQLGN